MLAFTAKDSDPQKIANARPECLSWAFTHSAKPSHYVHVIRSGQIAGTTFPFALTLVELLCGKKKRVEVAEPMMFPPGTFA